RTARRRSRRRGIEHVARLRPFVFPKTALQIQFRMKKCTQTLVELLLFCICSLLLFSACESEDQADGQPFVIAFEKRSYDYSRIPESQTVKLVFSESAK